MRTPLGLQALTGVALTASISGMLAAQAAPPSTPRDSVTRLGPVTVSAASVDAPPPLTIIQSATLPAIATMTAKRAQETVNLIDVEDAVKYLPNVFLRKRNAGETQATLGSRVWGTSSSARSLVFADGVPLTALIANNNTIGGPRWGLVTPAEIARIDMMFGPFSAAYAGNSMGAVMEITTRLPDRFEGSIEQTQAVQSFDLYKTRDTYGTRQTSATAGNRFGKLAFWVGGNYMDSRSQPLGYATAAADPSGTTGAIPATNKLNAPANVLGATGLLHSKMLNGKVKLAYDVMPALRLAYTLGYWRNDATSGVDTYLEKSGHRTYANQTGFASGYFSQVQEHTAQSLSLRSSRKGAWNFEVAASRYAFGTDRQRLPATAGDTTFGTAGRVVVLDGTGWSTLDAKALWRRIASTIHTVSFGAHLDRYTLSNTTFNTPDWTTADSLSGVFSEGDGKTRTFALWAQDGWIFRPDMTLTVGARYEAFRGYDGYNVNGTTKVTQPAVKATKVSPKAVLAWSATPRLSVTASVAKAYRFATASELYQLVTTGATFTSPNPNLKPDDVLAAELRGEHRFDHGTILLSLFQDDVHDAIISQFNTLVPGSSTLYSYLSNLDHVRARGVELSLGSKDLLMEGLELSTSVTYLDPRILATSGAAGATSASGSPIGKMLPNIPRWRGNAVTTYRPTSRLAFTLAGRYSGAVFTTLDNADVNPNTYQGFSEWFVADAHGLYRINEHWSASAGVDNLLNRKYFLFHPFPHRTLVANAKFSW